MRYLERRYTARQITYIYIHRPVRFAQIMQRVLRVCR
jgi:hypothetical protein